MSVGQIEVILVDEEDRAVGLCEKHEAHLRGLLHRAVSVFLFDDDGRMLVQRRAAGKYHSGGLWSNAACTHPRVGESLDEAVRRALREELGTDARDLRAALTFRYRAEVGDGLLEHEYDHVFLGLAAGPIRLNADEVSDVAWRSLGDVAAALAETPAEFTPWFRLLMPAVAGAWAVRAGISTT